MIEKKEEGSEQSEPFFILVYIENPLNLFLFSNKFL